MRRLILAAGCLVLIWRPAGGPMQAQAARPKLVVFLVVDQMRGDYPVRYANLLNKGLHRLTSEGAWYRKGAYPYLNTLTCVGHSTLGTGTLPFHHGMIQNVWYDRESGRPVACTSDGQSSNVSAAGTAGGPGDSAVRLLSPTLAEIMHRDLKARVVTISIKARSAIGLAGRAGDAVLWLGDRGQLQTSTAYAATLPAWADAFARANPATRDAGKVWERTLPDARYQYSDDPPGEKPGGGWSAPFPHRLGAAEDARYFAHWEQSPYADEYLEALAEQAIDSLHLGSEDHPDFLGVSFSSVDLVGHAFGPRSHEVQDMLVRLDATIGRLLAHLDERVGAAHYVLALSADHGVADVPEQTEHGGRILLPTVTATIDGTLKPAYGGEQSFVAANQGTDVYLKPGVSDRLRRDPATRAAVRAALVAMPGVARVLYADEIDSTAARRSNDPQIRAAALSYFAGRSGDLIVIPKENWIVGTTTTTHGTLYAYDREVPVILFGADIRAGVRDEPATPADVAPTLAAIAGVRLPAPDGRVLKSAVRR
jgi:predicted AlkP superfamily pyrophosphatase or phosphodiesterase